MPKLDDKDPVWEIVGFYLAQLCLNLTLMLSVEVIVIGGGVLKRLCIYDHTRKHFKSFLNGYLDLEELKESNLENYIVPSTFDEYEGAMGAAVTLDFDY